MFGLIDKFKVFASNKFGNPDTTSPDVRRDWFFFIQGSFRVLSGYSVTVILLPSILNLTVLVFSSIRNTSETFWKRDI